MRFTKEEAKQIIEALEFFVNDEEYSLHCPFEVLDLPQFCDKLCHRLFPKIWRVLKENPSYRHYTICPIGLYPRADVVDKFKRVLFALKKKFEKGGIKDENES